MGEVKARVPDGNWYPAARALVALLAARGLGAVVLAHGAVRVWNPAGEADASDKLGQAMSPGLRQELQCGRRADGVLWWFWVWSGPTRQSPPDLEPLCPIGDAETAAARVDKVLAVPFAEASVKAV
ncbi:hypothetical protein GCM10009527_098120 [Actinomadura nitritigenes]|uniref:Uncharacterized protein n=1 Tax=Actinomadura nitritigenes TaxID=134602 RepID=A0ABS3RGS6_9ACTN|nr:hypothetical protein [Actinomadura nitritigenes]MBO2445444.1 hypothetical protein [Actinomadura nitritigenes]